jgi:hypothetical protein
MATTSSSLMILLFVELLKIYIYILQKPGENIMKKDDQFT